MRLLYLRLHVRDFAGCFRFWRDTVGLTPRFGDENDSGGYAEFETGATTLAVFDARAMAAAVPGVGIPDAGQSDDRALGSFEVDDVDGTYERLMGQGVVFVGPPTDQPAWGIRAGHFRDLEGNLFEIYSVLAAGATEDGETTATSAPQATGGDAPEAVGTTEGGAA